MRRLQWFMAGLAAAAGAVAAVGAARRRLRSPGGGEDAASAPAAAADPVGSSAAPPIAEPGPTDEETAELRMRIDETRDRIRRRASGEQLPDAG